MRYKCTEEDCRGGGKPSVVGEPEIGEDGYGLRMAIPVQRRNGTYVYKCGYCRGMLVCEDGSPPEWRRKPERRGQ